MHRVDSALCRLAARLGAMATAVSHEAAGVGVRRAQLPSGVRLRLDELESQRRGAILELREALAERDRLQDEGYSSTSPSPLSDSANVATAQASTCVPASRLSEASS